MRIKLFFTTLAATLLLSGCIVAPYDGYGYAAPSVSYSTGIGYYGYGGPSFGLSIFDYGGPRYNSPYRYRYDRRDYGRHDRYPRYQNNDRDHPRGHHRGHDWGQDRGQDREHGYSRDRDRDQNWNRGEGRRAEGSLQGGRVFSQNRSEFRRDGSGAGGRGDNGRGRGGQSRN